MGRVRLLVFNQWRGVSPGLDQDEDREVFQSNEAVQHKNNNQSQGAVHNLSRQVSQLLCWQVQELKRPAATRADQQHLRKHVHTLELRCPASDRLYVDQTEPG